jgi:hypothetical protein
MELYLTPSSFNMIFSFLLIFFYYDCSFYSSLYFIPPIQMCSVASSEGSSSASSRRVSVSYDSRVQSIPFKLLHGYDPETPSIEPSYSDLETNKELQWYQRAKRLLLAKPINQTASDHSDTEPAFHVGQDVYYWEKSFGELKWHGPCTIIKVFPHKVRLQISPKTAKCFYNDRISPTASFIKTGEGTPQTQDAFPNGPGTSDT